MGYHDCLAMGYLPIARCGDLSLTHASTVSLYPEISSQLLSYTTVTFRLPFYYRYPLTALSYDGANYTPTPATSLVWMGTHSAGKLHIDCRKWWSKTRYILRIYQGPTRLRPRKPLHWALSLISYHVFVYYLVDYCTYSRIVGPAGLAGVLNDTINQSSSNGPSGIISHHTGSPNPSNLFA